MRHLPASLRNKPHIRALSMKVYPHTRNSMIVLGGSTPHEVFAYGDKLKCDCTAASFGRECAHIKAIELVYKESQAGKDLDRMFTLDRSSSEERKPSAPLPRKQKQLYAGIFSGWFITEAGGYGPSLGLKCLVTHSVAGKSWEKVDHITDALTFVSPQWWHKEKKGESSHFLAFVSTLTGSQPKNLQDLNNDEIKKLVNEHIGEGLLFTASIEKDKKGIWRNTIDKESFDSPDAAFTKLADAMRSRIETKEDKNGFSYVSKPQPSTVQPQAQEDPVGSGDVTTSFDDDASLENEVPF